MPEWLSVIDIAFIAVALLFALGGFQKGFAGQVAHIITFVVLGIVLFFAYPRIFIYFGGIFRDLNETNMMWIILAGLAALSLLFFIFVNKLLANVLKTQISDRSDRTYGFMLGLIRGTFIALFAMIFLVILGPTKAYDVFSAKSRIGRVVCYDLVPKIQPRINKSNVGDKFDKMREALIYQEEAGVVE